jgi:hypothetical protein
VGDNLLISNMQLSIIIKVKTNLWGLFVIKNTKNKLPGRFVLAPCLILTKMYETSRIF